MKLCYIIEEYARLKLSHLSSKLLNYNAQLYELLPVTLRWLTN